jgi:disulfide bond formation protein DsbB
VSVDEVSLFLALLAIVAEVGALVLGVLAIGHWLAPRPGDGFERVQAHIGPIALVLAGLVAIASMLGSLYFSEVADFPPCRLCWYQRIAMYPLAVILPVAAWRRDPGVRRYAAPLAVVGGLIAVYHVLIERFPSLETGACELANPCTIIWVEEFGYLTIPAMALSGFVAICALLPYATREEDGDGSFEDPGRA